MAKHKKHPKAQRMRRNAATAAPSRAPLPRATIVRAPRARTATEETKDQEDTRGWRALKAAGGALATTVAGAYLARQDWLPPKATSGVISAIGAALALGSPNKTVRSFGIGAMSAAGGQLGFMLIDEQLLKQAEDKERKEPVASKPPIPPPTKRQASDIPADTLARAYERARLRMALGSEGTN